MVVQSLQNKEEIKKAASLASKTHIVMFLTPFSAFLVFIHPILLLVLFILGIASFIMNILYMKKFSEALKDKFIFRMFLVYVILLVLGLIVIFLGAVKVAFSMSSVDLASALGSLLFLGFLAIIAFIIWIIGLVFYLISYWKLSKDLKDRTIFILILLTLILPVVFGLIPVLSFLGTLSFLVLQLILAIYFHKLSVK